LIDIFEWQYIVMADEAVVKVYGFLIQIL